MAAAVPMRSSADVGIESDLSVWKSCGEVMDSVFVFACTTKLSNNFIDCVHRVFIRHRRSENSPFTMKNYLANVQ